MYVCSIKSYDIVFDYHDTERILIRKKYPYYLTPKRFAKIEAWMIQNNKENLTKEDVDFVISQGWLSRYDSN
ncbi:MAG TPA: hypothetical protein P5136_00520 [Methanofastidiosum sp.]|nr:hypothetical protein [Methanofastidiosum sp.]